MRILQLLHSADPAGGGPVESVLQMSRCLAARGHMVELAVLDPPGSGFGAAFPGPFHELGAIVQGYGFSPALLRWLRERANEFDAVIVHGMWQFQGAGARRALAGSRTPYYLYPHGMLATWFQSQYPLKHLKKWIYWRLIESRVLRDAAAVLFTAEEERLDARNGFRPWKCREIVVSFGTSDPPAANDRQEQAFREHFPHLAGKRFLLYLSRIHVKKGVDLLLQAFGSLRSVQDLHLVIAGPSRDPAYLDRLKEISAKLPGEMQSRITWSGMISGDLKWGTLRAAEALVLPSHQENFGIVVAEALACAVPVLISNRVNIWREIVDAEAGLAEPDDLPGTQRLLTRWIERAPRDRMRANARACFLRHFEIESATDSLLQAIGGAR